MTDWGILGTGRMAATMAAAIQATAGARLRAVASRDPGRAGAFARRFGLPAHGDYAALLADPAVTVVYIATANDQHLPLSLAALAAGKAVLCEKPLATSAAEARTIAAAAAAADRFCMEAVWTHFLPAITAAEQAIRQGRIGEPRLISGSFGLPTRLDPGHGLLDRQQGGALLDRGCYGLSLALRLLGPVATVKGVITRDPAGGADLSAVAALGFANGALGSFTASFTGFTANDLVIAGTRGRLTLGEPLTAPPRLTLTPISPLDPAGDGAGQSGLAARLKQRLKRSPLVQRLRPALAGGQSFPDAGANPFCHQINHVEQCLSRHRRESPVLPLALSIATLELIDQIKASAGG